MSTVSVRQPEQKKTRRDLDLDRRYGRIGISALAAALRYQGKAEAPADPSPDCDARRFARATA